MDHTDTAFRFPHFMCVYWIIQSLFIPENNEVLPAKLIFISNSGITQFLISPLTHILSHACAGEDASDVI